jgi:hypothetical protein
MLPNERFALACRALYEEQGLIVDETNGEFAHCPYPKRYGDSGYYLLHGHHQHQGLLQSKDIGECCFFNGHAKRWLLECDYFPENYFELWDIYHEFLSGEHHPNYGKSGELHPMWGVRGENHPNYGKKSPEHSKRMSGEGNPNFGKKGALNHNFGKKNPALSERNSARKGELNHMWGKKNPRFAELASNQKGESNFMWGRKGELNPLSKRLEVTKPDGTKQEFSSTKEAGEAFGCSPHYLSVWAKKEWTPRKGKFTGYTFKYSIVNKP